MQPPNTQQTENPFGNWIRNWLHYNQLTQQYTRQAAAARKMRDQHELQIIKNLRSNNMANARIQVTNGLITLAEEKNTPGLTLSNLRSYLQSYYQQKGNHMNETENILSYIEQQRKKNATNLLKLKYSSAMPPIPPASSQPPNTQQLR